MSLRGRHAVLSRSRIQKQRKRGDRCLCSV
jgi:hypothetical protein